MQTRKRICDAAGSAKTCIAALLLAAAPAAAQDWPGFQGPDRSGVVQHADILTDWPDAGPPTRWTQSVGPGFGSAAIQNNTVYLLDRNANQGDTLRAFDLKTGQPRANIPYDAPGRISYHGSRSTPALTQTHAYTVGPFGHVTCFDLETNTIAWQQHMDDYDAQPPKWAWSQSPLIYQNWVIVAPMAPDAGLVALDQTTGEVAWRSGNIGIEGYGSPRLVTLAKQPQIIYYTATQVTGTHPDTGQTLWSYRNIPAKRAIPTPTPVGDNRLFITAGYDNGSALIEITKRNNTFHVKEIKRDRDHGGQIHSALHLADHLYVNLNTNENLRQRGKNAQGLGCFDAQGNLLWINNNTPDINRGPLLALGQHLVTLGGEDGTLRLIKPDPQGYRELAAAKIFPANQRRNMIWAPMSYADGHLILRSQSQLKCIDLNPSPR